MSRTTLCYVMSATIVVSLCASAAVPAAGQTPEKSATAAAAAFKTPWGEPDLQGIWANQTLTPLERPETFAGRAELSAEDIAQIEQTAAETILIRRDRRDGRPETDLARAYNDFWNDRGIAIKATKQSSLVIDPPDGRIPPYTPQALTKYSEWAKSTGRVGAAATLVGPRLVPGDESPEGIIDGLAGGDDGRGVRSSNPEDRGLSERCLSWGLPKLPNTGYGYNANFQVVQSPGYVTFLYEMGWETRIIPIDPDRQHPPQNVRLWLGDSIGRWEGDTLVIETTNFSPNRHFMGSFETLHLIERFRRVDGGTLEYQFTIDDPATWTKPWTVSVPIPKLEAEVPKIFEYSCHEGNYGMTSLLQGTRALERAKGLQ